MILKYIFVKDFGVFCLTFGQDFEADVWLKFWCSGMVEILELNFDQLVIWLDEDTLMRELNPWVRRVFGNVYYLFHSLPSHFLLINFRLYEASTHPPQIKKKSSRIEFQFSTNISLLWSQVGKTKLYILLTIKKVLLNKPSKHQIERPLFLKDGTIASVYFPPPFGPLIWWRSTPTEDLEPNISTMWRSVSSWILESDPIFILSSRPLFFNFYLLSVCIFTKLIQ